MAILLQSLRLIDSTSISTPKDYLYTGSEIVENTANQKDAEQIIDCSAYMGSAGWIDLRCMSGEPGEEYKESLDSLGALLASSGFVKAVIMPNTHPAIQTKNEVQYIKSKSSSWVSDLIVQGAVTKDTKGDDFTDILDLHNAGVEIFGDGLYPLSNPDRFMKALQYLQKFKGILFDCAYDPMLSLYGQMHEGEVSTKLGLKGLPSIAEEVTVHRNLEILKYTGGRLHLQTVSTAGAVKSIRKAKAAGLQVTADVSLYQLIFSDQDLEDFNTHLKVLPPFRGEMDRLALIEGLKDGTIDAIVSNHNPQDFDSKHMEFDLATFGMTGLQTFLPGLVQLSGELGWPLLIDKISAGPQRVLGLQNSTMNNITVFSPDEKWVLNQHSNISLSANSPWFGMELKGKVKMVINGSSFSLFQ
jgi:dihydroorotase